MLIYSYKIINNELIVVAKNPKTGKEHIATSNEKDKEPLELFDSVRSEKKMPLRS